jgi:tetratricopeptide (TPR) repeat protein
MGLQQVRVLLSGLLLLSFSAAAQAPVAGGQSGGIGLIGMAASTASVQIQVLTTGHAFLSREALVKLRNNATMHEEWATTHGSEAAFSGLETGFYTLEVSAQGYHFASQQLDIESPNQMQRVMVLLQRDASAAELETAAPSTIPSQARKETEKGLKALKNGKLGDAQKHLSKAYKLAPDNADINYLMGVALLQKKDGADPNSEENSKENDAKEAEAYLARATGLNPRHLQAWIVLGQLRLRENNPAGAAEVFQKAVTLNPQDWKAHWLLAEASLRQEKYQHSVEEAQSAIRLGKSAGAIANIVLGEALASLGRNLEAIGAFQVFLQSSPEDTNAAAVRQLISKLQGTSQRQPKLKQVAGTPPALTAASMGPPADLADLGLATPLWGPPSVDAVMPPVASGVPCPESRVLAGAGRQVEELVRSIARYSATEEVTHELFSNLGNLLRKQSGAFDYVAEISDSGDGGLRVSEYRIMNSNLSFSDHIDIRGLSALAMVFHPKMQSDYQMRCEGLGEWQGQPAWQVRFEQRSDRPSRLQSYKLGHEFRSVGLKGRAWIAAASFQILRMEAELVQPIPEIQLRSEHEVVEYGPVKFSGHKTELWLPKTAELFLDFRGNHYLMQSAFQDFRLFAVDTKAETKHPQAEN